MHRDIKANNCLLSEKGHLKLCDFGSSKALFPQDAWPSVLRDGPMRAPKASTIVGTLHTMAPEVAGDIGYSLQADWWSLGALLYEMVAGEPAFPALFGKTVSSVGGFDPDHYQLKLSHAYNSAFHKCLPVEEDCRTLREATTALITSLLMVRASSRAGPWTLDALRSNVCWRMAAVDWDAIDAGTSPPPSTTFDRRLGALELAGEGKVGDEEAALTDDQQDLFSAY
jgi:serine/threonine protein kinase